MRTNSNEPVSTWNMEPGWTTVAVMGSSDFDISQIDLASMKLGVGEVAPHSLYGVGNYDGDSEEIPDANFLFRVADVGVVCSDTEITLVGETTGGEAFEGTDAIRTINCPSCHP